MSTSKPQRSSSSTGTTPFHSTVQDRLQSTEPDGQPHEVEVAEGGRGEGKGEGEEQALSRPSFNPFFVLVEDVNTSEHFHPTVHYLFLDDDLDVLTDACVDALSTTSQSRSRSLTSSQQRLLASGSAESQPGGPLQLSDQRATRYDNSNERYIIVDIGSSGDNVTGVHSLTADWQALGAEITDAPTWETDELPRSDQTAGLMLRIEGVQNLGYGELPAGMEELASDEARLELVELFEKRMNTLRKVIRTETTAEPKASRTPSSS